MILEPKKIKSTTVSTFSPSICHEVMELNAMIWIFWICWVFRQLFHSSLLPSPRSSLITLHFLPLEWYHLHIWRRTWHPTPVLLPGKSRGWRGLVRYGPWGQKSRTRLSDFTFTFHFHALEKEMATHSCSCLENPRDAGAWWAAVYGVAQSQTRLSNWTELNGQLTIF